MSFFRLFNPCNPCCAPQPVTGCHLCACDLPTTLYLSATGTGQLNGLNAEMICQGEAFFEGLDLNHELICDGESQGPLIFSLFCEDNVLNLNIYNPSMGTITSTTSEWTCSPFSATFTSIVEDPCTGNEVEDEGWNVTIVVSDV